MVPEREKVMWSGPEIIVTIALGRKKSMQYVTVIVGARAAASAGDRGVV